MGCQSHLSRGVRSFVAGGDRTPSFLKILCKISAKSLFAMLNSFKDHNYLNLYAFSNIHKMIERILFSLNDKVTE